VYINIMCVTIGCRCEAAFSTGNCETGTGRCICRSEYSGVNCDRFHNTSSISPFLTYLIFVLEMTHFVLNSSSVSAKISKLVLLQELDFQNIYKIKFLKF